MFERESTAKDHQCFVSVHLRGQVLWFPSLMSTDYSLLPLTQAQDVRVSWEFCLSLCGVYIFPPAKTMRGDTTGLSPSLPALDIDLVCPGL